MCIPLRAEQKTRGKRSPTSPSGRVRAWIKRSRDWRKPRRLWKSIRRISRRVRMPSVSTVRPFRNGTHLFYTQSLTLSTGPEREIETLRKTLDAKRRTALMLNVSKQKQSIRVKRLEDLTRLIDDLRCERDYLASLLSGSRPQKRRDCLGRQGQASGRQLSHWLRPHFCL
jgi:hypothetical protein